MEKTPFKSKNFWANIVNIFTVFLVGAGVAVPSDTATDVVDAIFSFNPVVIGALLLSNIALPIYKTIKNKTGDWRASLFSTNFWGQVVTAALWVLIFYGVSIPDYTGDGLVQSAFNKKIVDFVGILFINVVLPILHVFVKPQIAASPQAKS